MSVSLELLRLGDGLERLGDTDELFRALTVFWDGPLSRHTEDSCPEYARYDSRPPALSIMCLSSPGAPRHDKEPSRVSIGMESITLKG